MKLLNGKKFNMKIFSFSIICLLCLFLASTAFGCLGTSEFVIRGKIMQENSSQPFENSKIYIELVDITDSDKPQTVQSLILENGVKNNYTYVLKHEKLNQKGIYIVTAHVDIDNDKTVSSGDYVSKPVYHLEPNMKEQPFDVYVYQV